MKLGKYAKFTLNRYYSGMGSAKVFLLNSKVFKFFALALAFSEPIGEKRFSGWLTSFSEKVEIHLLNKKALEHQH